MCLSLIDWLKKLFHKEEKEPEPMPAPLNNTFLFVEPMQHYLDYSSLVLHDLIAANKKSGQVITELIGTDANAAKVKETLKTFNPVVFSGCGHGNYETFTVECTELFMQVGNENVNLMKERVVHLNSCETSGELGPAIMDAGALAYLGSNESFWFYTGDPANTSRAVQSPFLTEWQFDVSLLQGKTVGEARADQLKKYEDELTYWVEGDGKTHPDAAEIARIININKNISSFSGESGTKPSPAGGGGGAGAMGLPPQVTVPATFTLVFILSWWLLQKY